MNTVFKHSMLILFVRVCYCYCFGVNVDSLVDCFMFVKGCCRGFCFGVEPLFCTWPLISIYVVLEIEITRKINDSN